MMNDVTVVIGGQFGSEAKGQVNGILARGRHFDWAVSNSGSQAGHTFVDGVYYRPTTVTRHLPIAGVIDDKTRMYIGPAAILDLDVLMDECNHFDCHDRVYIHRNAAVIMPDHRILDATLTERMGSTGKGNGAALAAKIMRETPLFGEFKTGFRMASGPPWLDHHSILVEAAQGFDLSIDRQFYPFCTSRNCWVGQALADAWIHPENCNLTTVLVVRAYPIRVAGNSGGWYPDQHEISWRDLEVEPEITTVTKRVRRVATFSMQQFKEACRINRPNIIAVSHLDYIKDPVEREDFLDKLHALTKNLDLNVTWLYGYGPDVSNWEWITP